jgi:hypothetical protein
MTRRVLAVMYRTVLRRCHTRIAEAIHTRTSQALVPALAQSRAVGGLRLFLFRRGEEVLKVVQREGKHEFGYLTPSPVLTSLDVVLSQCRSLSMSFSLNVVLSQCRALSMSRSLNVALSLSR